MLERFDLISQLIAPVVAQLKEVGIPVDTRFGPPVSAARLDQFEHENAILLPSDFRAAYIESDGFSIIWEGHWVHGDFQLPSLEKLQVSYSQWSRSELSRLEVSNPSMDTRGDMTQWIPFESANDTANAKRIGVDCRTGRIIALSPPSGDAYGLSVSYYAESFRDYLQRSAENGFICVWLSDFAPSQTAGKDWIDWSTGLNFQDFLKQTRT